MTTEKRIASLVRLAEFINQGGNELQLAIEEAYQHNKWFTSENIQLSLKNIREQFLDEEKINRWLAQYPSVKTREPKFAGIVMAGNIPLVGFHDFLCVFLSGHKALVKISSKDNVL